MPRKGGRKPTAAARARAEIARLRARLSRDFCGCIERTPDLLAAIASDPKLRGRLRVWEASIERYLTTASPSDAQLARRALACLKATQDAHPAVSPQRDPNPPAIP